jgi:hypothetical protein
MIDRQRATTEASSQKTLFEIRRKKTMMIKINDVIEKTLFRLMIIKDLMQKLTIVKKRKKDIMSMRRLSSDDLKLLTSTKNAKERMKKNRTLTFDISFFATTVRRIYVVLAHEMRREDINVFNQQKVIDHIIKQNLSLHKKMNIVQIA